MHLTNNYLIIGSWRSLDVLAIHTSDLTTHTSWIFIKRSVFLGYSSSHKGYKCLVADGVMGEFSSPRTKLLLLLLIKVHPWAHSSYFLLRRQQVHQLLHSYLLAHIMLQLSIIFQFRSLFNQLVLNLFNNSHNHSVFLSFIVQTLIILPLQNLPVAHLRANQLKAPQVQVQIQTS